MNPDGSTTRADAAADIDLARIPAHIACVMDGNGRWAQRRGLPADKITEKRVRDHLYAPDMPDPDLVVRTSGEFRLSNFMLWELAYSELVFTDVLWPDFRREHLFDAIREYQSRERRFGGVRSG